MISRPAPTLGSFRLRVGDIGDVAIDRLHALSVMVSWPHRPDDWTLLRQTGRGIAALDGIGRVLATAMWFPFGPRAASIGMVITSPRLQARGGGRWMMDHVLGQNRGRILTLNATRAARRLYASLGFIAGSIVHQHQGIAVPASLPARGDVRAVTAADLPALAALDRSAFGADRGKLLARLLELSSGRVLLRGGEIQAFALCRRFGRGHVIGPVVARDDPDAIAAAAPFVSEHAGRFLRVDTRQVDGPFAAFLAAAGLPVFDTVTSMSLRATATIRETPSSLYALASHTLG